MSCKVMLVKCYKVYSSSNIRLVHKFLQPFCTSPDLDISLTCMTELTVSFHACLVCFFAISGSEEKPAAACK